MFEKKRFKHCCLEKVFLMIFLLIVFAVTAPGRQNMINCVLATVDEKPITLFDIKVIRTFNLVSEVQEGIYEGHKKFLESYIDQMLILELAREQLRVSADEIKSEINRTKEKLGMEEFNSRLRELGLSEEELFTYFEAKILFDRVVGSRFTQKSYVSLKEIEEFYQNEYVPQQRARGEPVADLFQVLDELEARLQRTKRHKEIKEWTEELRQRADIIINSDCLKKLDKTEEK